MSVQGITGQWRPGWLGHWRCGRKSYFSNEKKAIKSAKRVSERSKENFIAYKCYDCTGWHIAHERKA